MKSRADRFTKQKHFALFSFTGLVAACVGLLMFVPLALLASRPDQTEVTRAFWLPGLILCVSGFVIHRLFGHHRSALTSGQSSIVVVSSWFLACLLGALPLYLALNISPVQALFESVSGWTTTGLTVIDVEKAPRSVLLWRSLMQLVGGAGFIVIMLATVAGPMSMGLSRAEGRDELLVPHVKQTMRIVLALYFSYIALGFFAYLAVGLDWFEALNHAFCAVATAGFSTKASSIGYWDSVAVEAVTVALMVLGGTNFLVAYLCLKQRFSALFRSGEVRFALLLTLLGIPPLFLLATSNIYPEMPKAARVAVFEWVSALTTTGYSTTSQKGWPSAGLFLLILVMITGGASYSTAGGLKLFRVYLLLKAVFWEIGRALKPGSAVVERSVWHGDAREYVSEKKILRAAMYFVIYIFFLSLGTLVIAAHGYPLSEALFEFVSTQGTVGLSIGITGPHTPPTILLTQIGGMLLGRLEFFVVFVALAKAFSLLTRGFRATG